MNRADNQKKPGTTKKRSGCLKKALLVFLAIGIVGWVSHRIRYATDEGYARQHDAEQAQLAEERRVREEQKAEEKRLADARKAEEQRLAAAKKEEERVRKEAEEAARAENRRMEDEFFARAVQARIAAEERVKSGNTLWKRYDFSGQLPITDGNEIDYEAQRLYSEVYEHLKPHVRNDGDELINFKGGEYSRKQRNDIIQRAINHLLMRSEKWEGASEPVRAHILWLAGRLYFEYAPGNMQPEEVKEMGTKYLLQAADLGSLPAATYVGTHGWPSTDKDLFQKHLKSAADRGYFPAQAQYVLSNYGPLKEAPQAWEFALNAASNDYPRAQFLMQRLYESAKKQDPSLPKETIAAFDEESKKWLALSAENGDAFSQTRMDLFSVAPTLAEREEWLRRAAAQDNPEAQYRLSILLAQQDKGDEAMRWAFAASRNDNRDALKLLKESTPKMKKEVRDLIRKDFGESHFLLNQDNPFHVYDLQDINHNLSILYLCDLRNNRSVILEISPPFGGSSHMEVVSLGTGDDPRWKIVYEGSNFEMLNVHLQSGSHVLQVVYHYQPRFPSINIIR